MNGTRIRDVLQVNIAETPAQCHKNIFGSFLRQPVATPRDRIDKIPGTRNMERVSAENKLSIKFNLNLKMFDFCYS